METNQRLEYVTSTLFRYHKLWLYPAIAGVALAVVYVFFFKSPVWTARQALTTRDNLLGQVYKPGQFSSLELMKSAQETILEVARKPQVIRNALTRLGPPSTNMLPTFNSSWPSEEAIEDAQGMITFSAPNGAEFGKTENFILNVKSSSRERARKLIGLLMDEIDDKISEVRDRKLQSMESELVQTRDAAFLSLEKSTRKLRAMEDKLGADVSTMNGLNNTLAGDDSVKRELSQIRLEARAAEAELESALKTQETLIAAKLDPERILTTTGEFVSSQPTLQFLQRSLVEAKQDYATNFGRYQLEHPVVKHNAGTIIAAQQQIYHELDNLTQSIGSQISVLRQRIRRLDEDAKQEIDRLASLGSKRIDHMTVNSEVSKKTEMLNQTQSELAEVQALRMAAGKVEWLTRVDDEPQVATRPDGMGKKATILAGGVFGLTFGLGLVMLLAPPMPVPQQVRPGRREDIQRRVSDKQPDSKRLEPPTLNEIVGPTAASAIQHASAATVATVNKGVEMAKSALGKSDENVFSETIPPQATNQGEVEIKRRSIKLTPIEMIGKQPENVRPVDLVKSADNETSFVRITPRKNETEPQKTER